MRPNAVAGSELKDASAVNGYVNVVGVDVRAAAVSSTRCHGSPYWPTRTLMFAALLADAVNART